MPLTMTLQTVYRTYVEGSLKYTGDDLSEATRAWVAATFALGRSVAGGIAVGVYQDLGGPKQLQLRDGWIMHVHEDGTVYLHPNIREKA